MNISAIGLLFGLLLLIVPIYLIYYFKLNVMRRFCVSAVRMAIAVAVMALAVYGAVALKSIVYDIVMLFVLAIVSAVLTMGRARLNTMKLIVPVAAGAFAGITIISFYGLFLILGLRNPFTPHLFVPFVGIVAGGIVAVNAKALQTYYSGLLHHDQLYNYLLGNGATHREAVRYFMRRCLQSSVTSVAKLMSRVVFLTAPALLLCLVMGGVDVFTATVFQVVVYFCVVSASLISLVVTLFLGQKYSFDEYERLKPVVKTSSSLSKRPGTGSESRQQEAEAGNQPGEPENQPEE